MRHGMKKIVAIAFACLITVGSFAGCKSSAGGESGQTGEDYPVTVGGITVNSKPESVVVLSENLADVILALSYESVLKAKSEECTQSELSSLPVVSIDDADAIKSTGAKIVLVDSAPTNADALALAGLSVAVIAPATGRSDFERLYSEVGALLNGRNTGSTFAVKRAQDIFSSIDDITRMVPQTDTVITACYVYDLSGRAATGDTLAGILVAATGATNGVANTGNADVTLATLKIVNPNYIFCPTGMKSQMVAADGFKDLDAVKKGQIYEMDSSMMERQGRTVVQAVSFMAGLMYPEMLEHATSSTPEATPAPSGGEDQPTATPAPTQKPQSGTYTTLQNGDKGDAVTALQERLYDLGYLIVPATGEFGPATEQAFKDFQIYNGYIATGIATPELQELLFSNEAVPLS